ncbi:M28 family metallopeptidase [Sorangium sp. So ce131]|uniref:M28 family metallopeptidase n=1 Tax=Sorangium sp. So ce131 TaxID=3133282 RepID=UPI003F62838B
MRGLVEALCSEECAGRAAGSPGGRVARAHIVEALRDGGLDPFEQDLPACGGANVMAVLPGEVDRYVLVGAHYDHLGRAGRSTYWGADDNAAAVAILVEVARALAGARQRGRGVILAAFDAEEPPHFMTTGMGSKRFAAEPCVPLDKIDMAVCMDLVGHAFGSRDLPAEVHRSLFALGAERSRGTSEMVDSLARAEDGVVVRRLDAEVIPPLSDYGPFWERDVPFLFLTSGIWRYYHTPYDTPERLDYEKMAGTARWLERFVRETCARPEPRVAFQRGRRDDLSTARALADVTAALGASTPEAAQGHAQARALLASCDREGRLPEGALSEAQALVSNIMAQLA